MTPERPTDPDGQASERVLTRPVSDTIATNMRESVTACLIVMNESERIRSALESVSFCDDVIVVDGGSDDDTPQLAASSGARLLRNPWPGYAKQRNVAIEAARTDWVLEIDADERVSPELRDEIEAFLREPPQELDMAVIPLRNVFVGKSLGPSAKYPMYRGRLFRRTEYRHDERRAVHEGLWPQGPVEPLTSDIIHILASSWREAFQDCVRYARLQARHRPHPSVPALVLGVVVRPPLKVLYRTIVVGGWRDGPRGIGRIVIECLSDALSWIYASRLSEYEAEDAHDPPSVGAVRVVGLAATDAGVERGISWLLEAERGGADVAMLGPARTRPSGVRVRSLDGVGPIGVIRTIEAEAQVRPIDAIVPCDRVSAVVARCIPSSLCKLVLRIDAHAAPADALRAIRAATRPPTAGARTAAA